MAELIIRIVKTFVEGWNSVREFLINHRHEIAAKAYSKTIDNWQQLVNRADCYNSWRSIAESLFDDGLFGRGRLAIYKTYTRDVVTSLKEKGQHRDVVKINADKDMLVYRLKATKTTEK